MVRKVLVTLFVSTVLCVGCGNTREEHKTLFPNVTPISGGVVFSWKTDEPASFEVYCEERPVVRENRKTCETQRVCVAAPFVYLADDARSRRHTVAVNSFAPDHASFVYLADDARSRRHTVAVNSFAPDQEIVRSCQSRGNDVFYDSYMDTILTVE